MQTDASDDGEARCTLCELGPNCGHNAISAESHARLRALGRQPTANPLLGPASSETRLSPETRAPMQWLHWSACLGETGWRTRTVSEAGLALQRNRRRPTRRATIEFEAWRNDIADMPRSCFHLATHISRLRGQALLSAPKATASACSRGGHGTAACGQPEPRRGPSRRWPLSSLRSS
jgi:hypothetical protein